MEQQQQVGKAMVRRNEEEILKHLRDQEQSEFSVSEYCEMFEIVEQTFYSWIKKYRSKPEDDVKARLSDGQGFAQIEVIPTFNNSRPQLFAEVGNIKLYKEVPAEYLKTLLL